MFKKNFVLDEYRDWGEGYNGQMKQHMSKNKGMEHHSRLKDYK